MKSSIELFHKFSKLSLSEYEWWNKYIQNNQPSKNDTACKVCMDLKNRLQALRSKRTVYYKEKRRTKKDTAEANADARKRNDREIQTLMDNYNAHIRSSHTGITVRCHNYIIGNNVSYT